jgi:hypothetical protein
LLWQGKQVSGIVVKMKDKKEFASGIIPLLSRTIGESSGKVFYAKGVGVIEFTGLEDGKLAKWQLIDIRDLK